MIKGWKYYNHAMIPTTAPHKEVDTTPVKDGSIFEIKEKPECQYDKTNQNDDNIQNRNKLKHTAPPIP